MPNKQTWFALLFVLAGLSGCSPASQPTQDLKSLLDHLRDGTDSTLVELLDPYLKEALPNEASGSIDKEAWAALKNGDYLKSMSLAGATYRDNLSDNYSNDTDWLLGIIQISAIGIRDWHLSEAALLELLSNSLINPIESTKVVSYLARLFTQYSFDKNIPKAQVIFDFIHQTESDSETLGEYFYKQVLTYAEYRGDPHNRYDLAAEYLIEIIKIFEAGSVTTGVLAEFHSELLNMQLKANQNDAAANTADTLYKQYFTFINARTASTLSNYFIYIDQFDKAYQVLVQSFKDPDSFENSDYWRNKGALVRLMALMGNMSEADFLFEESFGSFSQFRWDNETNKMRFPEHISKITKETCVGWMEGMLIGGSVVTNPGVVSWLAETFTWQDDFTVKSSVECTIEIIRNRHYGYVETENYEDATKQALSIKNVFFDHVTEGSADLYEWTYLLSKIFEDLKDHKSAYEVVDWTRREYLRRQNLSKALVWHLPTLVHLGRLGNDNKQKSLELSGRTTYNELALHSQEAVWILKMARMLVEGSPNDFSILDDYYGKNRFRLSEEKNSVSEDVEHIVISAGRDLANGDLSTAIDRLKELVKHRKKFPGQKTKLAHAHRLLYELLLANDQVSDALVELETAFSFRSCISLFKRWQNVN